MSRGVHRGVYSSLLDDRDFQLLTPRARHTFLTIRQCRECGPAGIFIFYPAITAQQTGYTVRQVEVAIQELESPPNQPPWVMREAPVIWIRNALLHDPTMHMANPKHRRAVERWIAGLPRLNIVLRFCDYYEIRKPFDRHSIAEPLQSSPNTEDPGTQVPNTDPLRNGNRPTAPAAGGSSPGFEEFYTLYPRKKAPAAARRAWSVAVKKAPPEAILAALTRQLADFSRRPSDRVPYPATWLNGEQWRNEPDGATSKARAVNDPWQGQKPGELKLR